MTETKVKQEGTFGIYPVEKKPCGRVEVRSTMFPNKEDKYQDLTTYLHNVNTKTWQLFDTTSGLSCLCQSNDSIVWDQLKLLASFALDNSQAANSSFVDNLVYTSDAATIILLTNPRRIKSCGYTP